MTPLEELERIAKAAKHKDYSFDWTETKHRDPYFCCHPDTILQLIAELREAREVIAFYADETTYEEIEESPMGRWPVDDDKGQRARAYLKGKDHD